MLILVALSASCNITSRKTGESDCSVYLQDSSRLFISESIQDSLVSFLNALDSIGKIRPKPLISVLVYKDGNDTILSFSSVRGDGILLPMCDSLLGEISYTGKLGGYFVTASLNPAFKEMTNWRYFSLNQSERDTLDNLISEYSDMEAYRIIHSKSYQIHGNGLLETIDQ